MQTSLINISILLKHGWWVFLENLIVKDIIGEWKSWPHFQGTPDSRSKLMLPGDIHLQTITATTPSCALAASGDPGVTGLLEQAKQTISPTPTQLLKSRKRSNIATKVDIHWQ